ncbi:site-specific DNA-methyltransferase [Aliarcobacter butzleri]|uniref:site-specific DNA-methyltransferase n=1 Tax=Aliarcobacter butzleri TaxID=28197 RepID=UPI001EDB51EB|nr:site-specific DNA-methyltransferase [Aliarcobacter butzleri]MCG3693502.1 site-specific DNA-methyltransferase [Aliarcobacter butzleri]
MPYIDWMGKNDVVNHHKRIPYKTIECKETIGDENSQNMIIKGDNLLALKSLLPYYASSVKMIYIDPPYNTGNTSWVYNDNMDSPVIKKWLEKTVNAEDLSRSDKWLCMMYPRLKLLRELLKDDGVIFISIDDAEVAHLRMICDDIFGKENFIITLVWQKRYSRENREAIGDVHEFILVYGKNKNKVQIGKLEITEEQAKIYKNPNNDPKGRWRGIPLTAQAGHATKEQFYEIIAPEGKIHTPPAGRCWGISKATYERYLSEGRIYFGKDNNSQPNYIRYLSEVDGMRPWSWWTSMESGHTDEAKKEILNIFGKKDDFDTPKPTRLIQRILQISTSKDDIILDSFAGSGTTAHAVLEQNAIDGGNRKFILIETMDYAKDITAERVKRVVEGYSFTGKDKTTLFEKKLTTTDILNPEKMQKLSLEANKIIEEKKDNFDKIEKSFDSNTLKIDGIKDIKSFKEGIGGGFKYCELSEDIFDEFGELNPKLTFAQIAKHIYFVEFKKPICKDEIHEPYVGEYENRFIYFFENRFKVTDMKKIIKEHKSYKQIIIYTKKTSLSEDELKNHNITVRYIPYDIKDN